MTIKKQLTIMFAVLISVSLFSALYLGYKLSGLTAASIEQTERTKQLRAVEKLTMLNKSVALAAMDAIVDKDSGAVSDSVRQESSELFSYIDTNRNKLMDYADTDMEKEAISKILDNFKTLKGYTEELFTAVVSGADQHEFDKLDDEIDNLASENAVIIAKMSDSILKEYETASSGTLSSLANTKMSAFITSFLLVFLAVGIFFAIYYKVIRNLDSFTVTLRDFTDGEGDLTRRIKITSTDEIGIMAGYFNKFVENIQKIVTEVKESASSVSVGSEELSSTMQELTETFTDSSRQVESIASAISEITATTEVIVSSIEQSAVPLDAAIKSTDEGADRLDKVKKSMNSITHSTERLATTISGLMNSSAQIGEILNVISDIADQTNLLALNAAIEAARAGDAGRGFAVVADEVRKLAERTQKATSEIDGIIRNFLSETQAASNEMNESEKNIKTGNKLITETDESFRLIVDAINEVNLSNGSIKLAISEQSSGIQNVNENAVSMSSGLEHNVSTMSEVNNTIELLARQAMTLNSLVDRFRI